MRLFSAEIEMFPGVELSSLKHHIEVFDWADLGIVQQSFHNCRSTLRAWFERLAEHRDEAIRLGGVRTYSLYLCYLAVT